MFLLFIWMYNGLRFNCIFRSDYTIYVYWLLFNVIYNAIGIREMISLHTRLIMEQSWDKIRQNVYFLDYWYNLKYFENII